MRKNIKPKDAEILSKLVVKGMQEKKGQNIVIIDLREIQNSIADFFVVCSGKSDTQVEAIADSIDKEVHSVLKENPAHVEGKNNKEWMLIDYINVVAHVFKQGTREFYNLEGMWGDAKIEEIETISE